MTIQPLEIHSWDSYCDVDDSFKPVIEADQLRHIVDSSGGTLNPESKDIDSENCVKLLENQEFRQDFLKCWKEGRLDKISNLALLQSRREEITSLSRNVSSRPYDEDYIAEQEKATLDAWSVEFKGEADATLWKHIKHLYATSGSAYAPYTAIIQSSGMGKSRVIDELAKKRFVIPICLRPPGSTGFPPSDESACDLLTFSKDRYTAYIRVVAFLCALFSQAAEEVRTIRSDQNNEDPEITARCFRDRMTNNQSAKSANQYRRDFFASVTKRASEILPRVKNYHDERQSNRFTGSLKNPLVSGFTDLVNALQATSATPSPTEARFASDQAPVMEKGFKCDVNTGQAVDEPLVVLVLDEAHVLSEVKSDESGFSWSYFGVLRRALWDLRENPLFTLFLSTTGMVTEFVPSQDPTPVQDSSMVVLQIFKPLPPFTDLGFDSLVQPLPNTITLETMTREKFIVQFGRPLFASRYYKGAHSVKQSIIAFAAGKLLNIPQVRAQELDKLSEPQKLACLSQRLPLEFYSSNPLDSDEMEQIECHMRICLKIDPRFNTMRSISPSEPLLSEAAYAIMQGPHFNAPDALLSAMRTFSIHKGDGGEILTLLLLTLARDGCVRSNNAECMDTIVVSPDDNRRRIISITEFIKQLFHYQNLFPESQAEDPTKLARQVAKESDPRSIREHFEEDFKDAHLHFNHCIKAHDPGSVDRRYLPSFLIRGAAMLCPSSLKEVDIVVPFLLGKDVAYRDWKSVLSFILVQVRNDAGFGTYKEWYFNEMDPYRLGILQATDEPVNFIRIFFSLVTSTPGLRIKRTKLTSPSKTDYYAYDIWCAGIDPSFLVPIDDDDKGTWEALLDASTSCQDIYNQWVKGFAYQNP